MSENITRISDLPENNSASIHAQKDLGLPNSYMPMNVHPNPYGNNQPPMDNVPMYVATEMNQMNPSSSPSFNRTATSFQDSVVLQMPQQRLPSRDIKMDESQYLHDEQITSNYVPRPNISVDYIEEYEKKDKKKEKYEQEKHRERLVDVIFAEIQTPLVIAILFFIFQMKFIHSFFIHYLHIFQISGEDGNLNFNGLLLKSVLFGIVFYYVERFTDWLSEL